MANGKKTGGAVAIRAAAPTDDATGMTAAQAAAAVARPIWKSELVKNEKSGDPEIRTWLDKKVPVAASEVIAFRNYGDRVVVVTQDGQKFDSRDA